ncbi:MAG TPA: hypothetical protein VIF57_29935 [Polyangia bacterium]|jgi:hypothetical protein
MAAASLLLAALLATESQPAAGPAADDARTQNAAQEATAGAGVAPVELIPRLELRQSFAQLTNGTSVRATTAQIDIQFLNRLLLRYQGPLVVASTPAGQISGFGDAEVDAIALLGASPTFVAVIFTGVVLDTASQPALGAGKKQLVVGAGAAIKPLPWWLPYLLVQEQVSVAGDDARPDVNQLVARVGNIAFGPGYAWLKLDLDTLVDFEQHRGQFFGRLEAGRLLVGRVGLFMRGGTQLLGTREVDYSLEVGIRYLFRLGNGSGK